MKALTKKRIKFKLKVSWNPALFNLFKLVNLFRHQLFWYAAAIVVYCWFMYWIAYDIFVWHKTLAQGNITNYICAAASVAFIWAEVKLFKTKPPNKKISLHILPKPEETQKAPQQALQQECPQPSTPQKTANLNPCKNFKNLQNANQIPDECLTCTNLLQCRKSRNSTAAN